MIQKYNSSRQVYEPESPGQDLHRRRVVVKFYDYVELPYEDGVEEYIRQHELGPWDRLVAEFPEITLKRLYIALAAEQIAELVELARRIDQTYNPPNFFTYFVIEVPVELDEEALAAALAEWDIVELAYVESEPVPPPAVDWGSDQYAPLQFHLNATPNGVDAKFAWGFPGGDGAGVQFLDVERGWQLNHPDLPGAAIGVPIWGESKAADVPHGTAVLGVVVAVDNSQGCIGIAPNASAKVASIWPTAASTMTDRPNALLAALGVLQFGDVLLIEDQLNDSLGVRVPVEIEDGNFSVIRLATALGIVVVEAAGNGGVDLSTRHDLGEFIFAPGTLKDSGAIIVGACCRSTTCSSSGHIRARRPSSNYGTRVNCYAWGEQVWTLHPVSSITTFAETSSASAIIAGVALVVQGLAANNAPFHRFGSFQMRQLLSNKANGTLSANPSVDLIGVMPDLNKIVSQNVLNLSPDVYLRDFVGDTGDPHTDPISSSPDIILRKTIVSNPQADFGAGSGTENSNTLGSEAEQGQTNFVYVRVKNRGGTAAAKVTAKVYWSPVATLVTPNNWNLIGSVDIPMVPTGNVLTVSDAILWSPVPATGHYCFVGILDHPNDPQPQLPTGSLPGGLTGFGTMDNYRDFIRRNNNVTWRNFNVVNNMPPPGMGFIILPFLATGMPEETLEMRLEVEAMLPEGAQIWLEGPLYFMRMLAGNTPFLEVYETQERSRFLLHPRGVTGFENILFPAGLAAEMAFVVDMPEAGREWVYELFIRQLYEETEVGRITWHLAPLPPEETQLPKKRNRPKTRPV